MRGCAALWLDRNHLGAKKHSRLIFINLKADQSSRKRLTFIPIRQDYTMAHFKLPFVILVAAALAACTPPDHYPISGETCSEGDPVQELNAEDCAVPGA